MMLRRMLEDVSVAFGLMIATVINNDVIATIQLVFNMVLGVVLLILRVIKLVKDAMKDGKITNEEKARILDEITDGVPDILSGIKPQDIYHEDDER